MIIDRIFTPGLAQVAYLIADPAAAVVAVIDPRRDVEAYVRWAAIRGYRIVAICETHIHADFVSGARELAAACGAPVYASRIGHQLFTHRPLDDGDEIAVGAVTLRARWTPGHTPEHLAYLAIDPSEGEKPVAIFSGDALFVGEVGRPDLMGEGKTQFLAEQLFYTLNERLAPLDDTVVVYPGHTAGSACGRKIGDAPKTTMGQERMFNYAFKAQTLQAFGHLVLDRMPRPPTYYPILKQLNRVGPPLLDTFPEGEAMTALQVSVMQHGTALVIDTRTAEAFGAGHVPGALFAGLGENFTTWMGWLAPYERDLIVVLDADARFDEACTELHRIGLDRIAGYLAGGMTAWRVAGLAESTTAQLAVEHLAQILESSPEGLFVLDVRSDQEWAEGHIFGARHRYAGEIVQGVHPPIDDAAEVAVICGTGYRSSVVTSLLQAHGYANGINVVGGMDAWRAAGLPTIDGTSMAAM